MAMSKTQKKAAEKVALYTSLLKLGQPKKIAMKEVRKQFKSGLDSSTCSDAARKLGITNGQMKSRAIQHNLALKTAKLVKTPKVTTTAEVVGFTGKLPKDLFDFIATWKTLGAAHGFSDLHIVGNKARATRPAQDIELDLE